MKTTNNSIKKKSELNLQLRLKRLFNNQYGIVVQVYDEIVHCIGMPNVKIGEIVIVQDHIAKRAYKGLVININWNTVSCIFFTDTRTILPGMKTRRSSWPVSIRLTSDTVGNIVDCLGYPLKQTNVQHTSTKTATIRLERPAPGITLREPIYQPLHTGSILIDSLFPIGRGQRELILGDRQTGKTSIAINAIRTQKYDNLLRFFNKNLYCFYVAIGQKKSNITKLFYFLKKTRCLYYTTIIAASASEPASLQFLAPYAGCALAEYFRDRGHDTLVVYDDLSKQAVAYRQISLLLKRPPGREAYPGDIFYLHARLLERAAKMSQVFKGGSLTALPIVETLVGDISSYIPTNVISITDGQIFLDNQIFNKHYKPAVNIELSVSRVGAKAQLRFYRKISKTFKNALLKYYLKADQINISDNKGETDNVVVLGQRLFIIVTHKNLMCIELQFFLMYLALSGYLNNYSLEQVSRLITKLGLSYTQNFNLNINFFKNIKL